MSSGSDLEDITNWKPTCVQPHFVCKIYVKMGVVWNFDNSIFKINFIKKRIVSSPKFQYGFDLDSFGLVADVKMRHFLWDLKATWPKFCKQNNLTVQKFLESVECDWIEKCLP